MKFESRTPHSTGISPKEAACGLARPVLPRRRVDSLQKCHSGRERLDAHAKLNQWVFYTRIYLPMLRQPLRKSDKYQDSASSHHEEPSTAVIKIGYSGLDLNRFGQNRVT